MDDRYRLCSPWTEATGTFTVRKAQVKVGNKLTEWSIAPEDIEENANTLIRYAEHALYNAKESGKNKIVEFSKMNFGA